MPVKKTSKEAVKKPVKTEEKPVKSKKPVETKKEQSEAELSCSFCDQKASSAKRLIAGPNQINICDECVGVSMRILGEESGGYFCPLFSLKTNRLMSSLGSELNRSPAQRTRTKYEVLYLAPNNPLSEKIYNTHVLPIAEKQKIKVKHFSEILNSKLSFNKELLDIYNASLVIADIHGQDPNIMYFLGMLKLIGKPLIMLAQKPEDLPEGLESEKTIFYKNAEKSLSDITSQIQPVFLAIKKIKKLTKSSGRKKQPK